MRVDAVSVNRGEMYLLEERGPGWQPGKDIAGVVAQAAADGTGPAAGQAPPWGTRRGAAGPSTPRSPRPPAVIPESVSAIQAAALPLAGLTALRLLRVAGNIIGPTATGASGGVGHFITELAAGAGQVTAVTGSAERGRRLAELGAVQIVPDVAGAAGPTTWCWSQQVAETWPWRRIGSRAREL